MNGLDAKVMVSPFFDVDCLLEKLNSRLQGQKVSISKRSYLKVRWYNQIGTGFNQKTVERKLRYDLNITTNDCLFGDIEKVFGHILIEGGIYDEHEMPYEACSLTIHRSLRFKSGADVQPMDLSVEIQYVDEYGEPELHKKYASEEAARLIPPKWFVQRGLEFIER